MVNMKQYINLAKDILENGTFKGDRTGTGTKSIFGTHFRINLQEGFPLLTTKKVFFKAIVHELLWFLSGSTNIKYLLDNNVHIWDEWADANGDLGPVYGKMWVDWQGQNQIDYIVDQLKTNPNNRRLLVSAWNPSLLPDPTIDPKENVQYGKQALPPCHYSWQCYVNDGKLSLSWNQRSVDVAAGLPFNIASYALLTHMLAQVSGLEVGDLIFNGGDTHLYSNHIEGIKEQITREPLPLCRLELNPEIKNIYDFKFDDIKVVDYQSHGTIKFPISV